MNAFRALPTLNVLVLFLLLSACQGEDVSAPDNAASPAAEATISGTVSYRERMALVPGSQVVISLQDVSRADVSATVLSEVELIDPGQVPIPFTLTYDPALIDERMTYALQARILGPDQKLVFINDTHTPVLTRGAGKQVDLMLVRVAGQTSQQAPGVPLQGMFRYFADAPQFRDCSTGKTFPVAMTGPYIDLERAYLGSGVEAGQELKVSLRGRYLQRPSMEGNTNEIMLMVDVFEETIDSSDCIADTHAELRNTYWRLDTLNGERVAPANDQREAHFVLGLEDSRVHGFSGCNNFFGQYSSSGDALSFSSLGSTMMACPDGMDTEAAFLQALGETTRASINGLFLQLYAEDRPLARLEAVYLP